ncbi:DUF1992 domain-containing protein [Desulfonema ishimotonii]|uniref:DUF1992 domain-containing protein n=1 Tax=Desulfonema ishimotonii TaxID=45657 RepID=A0A401G197_9BACT|nr:DnaJ family domain-containing protein [Desulfonema ishimotonii]GBC62985.1 DUF1992 domain-containing protein [Desulfonema ishimotonii]
MITGFGKIIEERIRVAQKKGHFDNLEGAGKPLALEDDNHIPEDLRLSYKVLKNSGFVPPEIEVRKEIRQTEDLLAETKDTAEQYRAIKKLNFLIMKLNSLSNTSVRFEMPQRYMRKLTDILK